MKIVNLNAAKRGVILMSDILMSDIPVGTVFSGTYTGIASQKTHSGVFFKAAGPSALRGSNGMKAGVLVVKLDEPLAPHAGYINATLNGNTLVLDYLALNVELVVKGAKS